MRKIINNKMENYQNIEKIDFIIISIIIFIYSILFFYKLGNMIAPNTFYSVEKSSEVLIDLKQDNLINTIKIYNGENTSDYYIYISENGTDFDYLINNTNNNVFSWDILKVNARTRYIKLVPTNNIILGEIGIYNNKNELISNPVILNNNKVITKLSDEVNTYPRKESYMNSTYFDEVYFARTAYDYANNIKAYEWVHPPLGKVIQAIPIFLSKKMTPFNYRLMSNISGLILIVVMYFFSLFLFRKRKLAILTTSFMMFDTFYFTQCRIGTIDSYLVLFITTSILFMYLFMQKKKTRYLFLSGLMFSLSISIKWIGMYCGLVLAILYLIDYLKTKKKITNYIVKGLSFFVVLPIIIYILIFLLFSNNYYKTNSIKSIIKENQLVYKYHSELREKHSFSSKWYTWPISYKPIWYHQQDLDNNKQESISCLGNLVIWIGGIFGAIYSLLKMIVKKDRTSLIIIISILCLWLPFMFIPRIMYLYHYFPTLPFIYLALSNVLYDLSKKIKYIIPIYMILSLLFFLIYLPVASGFEINKNYTDKLRIMKSWYF